MTIDTYLTAQQLMEATGLSASELASLPMDEFARLSGRPTPAQAAIDALDARYESQTPQAPAPTQTQPLAPEPQGVSVQDMTMEQYAQLRSQLGVQGREYGVGITTSQAGTQDWIAAAQAKSGRHGWENANEVQAPRLEGRTVLRQDDFRDTRPAAQRFTFPGSAFQG